MILPELLIVSSYLFVSSSCREFHDYDYENLPNSVEFGAPSQTAKPTTRSSSPSPPYWWMNSAIFNNKTSIGGADGRPKYEPEYKQEYTPEYKPGYKARYQPGYKKKKYPGVLLLPPVKSIKIYECEGWAMRCEYRPSQDSQYPLHCKFSTGSSEDF